MNKKGTKALASATLMSLVLTTALATGNVKAAAGQVTRVGGTDRYETASKVATSNFTTSDNVVLVSGEGYADSVSASVLAKKLDAPIVLTGSQTLDANAKSAIETLKAKNIYIIGGTGSISASIEDGLKSDYTVTRLGGQDRYATNLAIANKLVDLGVSKSNIIAVAGTGFADALSVAPVAAADNEILLLTNNNADTMKNTADFAKDSNVTVVGTTNVVSDATYNQLNADKRIDGGTDRFDTNLKVLKEFDSDLKADKLYVANATGNGYADALVASAIAGKYAAPLVLTDTEGSASTTKAIDYIGTKATKTTDLQVVGGTGVVSDATIQKINDAVNTDLQVKSVTPTSATQVEVKFNKAVDPASLFADGESGTFKSTSVVEFTSIDSVPAGSLSGELSKDGQTLTVTSANALSKRYNVVVDGLSGKDGSDFDKYDEIVNIPADTTAPTIVSTTKTSASTFKVVFSEPIKTLPTPSYKLDDGTDVTGVTNDFAVGSKEVTFTLPSTIDAGKAVTATIIGAQDQAGNLLTPNPATITLVKGDKDGTAPTVSSVTQTGAKTFAVKFSEQLISNPAISYAGTPVAPTSIVQDTTDPTVYNVTAPSVLDGATDVTVSSFTDLSGEVGTTTNKVVNFVKDTAAPKVVSSAVSVDSTDRNEYLEITFDKDVDLAASPTVDASGSYINNYVTTPFTATGVPVNYKSVSDKKVVRVALNTLLASDDVQNAAYTLNLTFAGITNGAGIAADDATASFTRGKDGVAANTDVANVTDVAQGADNNKVNVTFDRAVDGASATDPSNYKVDGATIDSVTLNPVSGGTQVAVLNLKAGSNQFTGVRNINISNVKALGSTKVMNPYFTNAVELKENVAPTVVSAKLTATDKIELTFSEDVSDSTADDFEVLVGGASLSTPETVDTGIVTSKTTVLVTIPAVTTDQLSKGISLKALNTLDIKDADGNKLSVPSNITVTQ
ncbi:cell wall-binding repeat-containing protein [Clostridium tyrobutyricum]|uniref:cell wall-binding repeat-containing protein n=1 Tax=Clostridium tyrobutyricum TaxID=1519 RepID=UPI001C38FD8F|nr:cell wall-binding repeat-containing protein [Clostridium tyrobutyricum]MBV4419619.1 cell wall-binding repeat-containing protein [Clostridium tyrobutyricum]